MRACGEVGSRGTARAGCRAAMDGQCDALECVCDALECVACLCGEVAERSKALDWNSSNISTGVRGFESHPLRQLPRRPLQA